MGRLVKIASGVLATLLVFGGFVRAAENGVLNYPPGAAGVFQNYFPPIPGVFGRSQLSVTTADGLYGSDGKKLPVPFQLTAVSETMLLLASYSEGILGAHTYSQIIVPRVRVSASLYGNRATSTGISNVTVDPLILYWQLDQDQAASLGFEIVTPLATYDSRKMTNAGTGYASYEPTVGYRYDQPNGPVVSVLLRAFFNTKNPSTDYYSGATLVTDFDLGWNL